MSQSTWNVINASPRHGQGKEKIPRDRIKAGIPCHVKEDVVFWAVRFAGRAPMVGYQDGAVFHILWLDPKFKLYPH